MTNPCTETNARCFTHRLPNETLEAIFIRYAHDYFHEHYARPISTAPSWVDVSYVSRHWRSVALDCSTLWTYLFVTSPRWTEELLARSKQALLKVALCADSDGWDQDRRGLCFLEQVKGHVERIQDLRLDYVVGPQHPFLSELASRARRLQHLSITHAAFHFRWPSLHFDGDTPALRTLHLEHCVVSLPSLKLDDLTKLSLKYDLIRFRQDTTEFLDTLSHMKNLQYLSIRNALTSATGFLSSAGFCGFQKINLPYLSQLLIFDQLSAIIALLSCITIPSKTEIMLGPDFSPEHASSLEEYVPLYALLKERYSVLPDQAPSVPAIRSVVIANSASQFGCTQFIFRTAGRDLDRCFASSDHPNSSCSALLQISLLHRQLAVANRRRILSCICSSMPLSQVRSVDVRNPSSSVVFWRDILEQLPELRHLKLSEGPMPDLASQIRVSPTPCNFAENEDEHSDRDRDRVLVPALEELELRDISFSTVVNSGVSDAPFEGADFKSLCDALATRKASRGRLTLTQCVERRPDFWQHIFDLEGRWGDGQFCIVSRKKKNFCEQIVEDDYDYDDEAEENSCSHDLV